MGYIAPSSNVIGSFGALGLTLISDRVKKTYISEFKRQSLDYVRNIVKWDIKQLQ